MSKIKATITYLVYHRNGKKINRYTLHKEVEIKQEPTPSSSFPKDSVSISQQDSQQTSHPKRQDVDIDPEKRVSDFVKNTKEPVRTEFKIKETPPDTNPYTITIIHTNDLHGNLDPNYGGSGGVGKGGMAYVAGMIDKLKQEDPDYIIVDAGDISYAPPYSDRNRFNPMPEIMNKIGYDVVEAGNHEFQWEAPKYGGPEGNPHPKLVDNLKELQEATQFPIICANAVRSDTGKRPDYLKPYIIKKVGNVNVGVIGVVTKRLATHAHPLVGKGWKILDQVQVLKEMIPKMKEEGADIIVVISHDNLRRNQYLISQVRGIDLMIGGHDHQRTDRPITVTDPDGRKVPLVEAGAYGYLVGKLKVEVDPKTKQVVRILSTLYPVNTQSVKPDKEIAAIVDKWVHR